MITPIDSLPWAAADLTGNSAIVPYGGAHYVVGNRRNDNTLAVYMSSNHGFTWSVVATIQAPLGTTDPAVAMGSDGKLHIVVARPNAIDAQRSDVVKFTFDTVTSAVTGPVVLIAGSKTMSAYDLLPLPDHNVMVVASALEPTGHAGLYMLQAFIVTPGDAYTTATLEQSPWTSGDTCGSVSLIQPAGGDPELYYTKHHRAFTFRPTRVDVLHRSWNALTGWSASTSIYNYTAMFTDDKLTVVPLADGRRALAQAYHNRTKQNGMQATVLYGVGTWDVDDMSWSWAWRIIEPTADYEVKEPVIETDGASIYLLHLQCSRIDGTVHYEPSGTLCVGTLDPATLLSVPTTGAWQQFKFRWLRGTKYQVEALSKWMVLGMAEGSTTNAILGGVIYFSLYNLAPHAAISPTTLTLQRGVAVELDATGTTDPDLDSLTYTWTHNYPDRDAVALVPILGGKKAFLTVAKAIGPLATAFQVTVSVTDGFPGHESSASCEVTVPFNHEPVITLPSTLAVTRNSSVNVEAQVADAEVDDLTLSWRQLDGTPIALSGITTNKVKADVYRVHPDGENITLQFLAEDGVNRPVFKNIVLQVGAMEASRVDTGILTRRFFETNGSPASISQRNNVGSWANVVESELRSDLFKTTVFTNATGANRFCYLSPLAAQIMSQGGFDVFYRACSPPADGGTITDCYLDELDQVYLLTDTGHVLRYTTPGPDGCSDWPDNVINLGDMSTHSYSHIEVKPLLGTRRLITVWGAGGILMFMVDEGSFVVMDCLTMDQNSGMLPSDFVQFIRLDEVESIKSGKLFAGVIDDNAGTIEVLVDLAYRRIIGQWDRQTLMGRWVNTGEILAQVDDTLMGVPDAPTWKAPELVAGAPGLYTLSWDQVRPDLVVGYEVWLGRDAAIPSLYTAIPAGTIRSTKLITKPGHIYHLTVRAIGRSGVSAFSMEHTLTT